MDNQINAIPSTKALAPGSPFFSIIMPVFNASVFLPECLDSILAQDFQDWEAILVDDGSSDSSVGIAEEYARRDPRIKVFTSHVNSGGAYVPRLRAAALAAAPYVVTIDADDKVSPDLLSSLHYRLAASGSDLVIPELWKWTAASTDRMLPAETIDTSLTWKGADLVVRTLVEWEIPLCGFAARRDIYLEADRRLSEADRRPIFADELHSRWMLFLSESVAFCHARYLYRDNDQSVTHLNLPRIAESRMRNCDALIEMAGKAFGPGSPVYFRALENKLYEAVGLLRKVNSTRSIDSSQKAAVMNSVSSSMQELDLSLLKGRTSPRYLALMRLPMPLARLALKILDPIIYRKNGF